MDLIETTRILSRILEQTEYSIEYNGKRLEDAKNGDDGHWPGR